MLRVSFFLFFFFQAEDGIRDYKVTGVQTCALPISLTFMNVVFMKVRGGRLGFHWRGLYELGSVYYGRAAGVGVMGSCHGFRSGFKVAGGAVVEQIHSLGIDASVRDS